MKIKIALIILISVLLFSCKNDTEITKKTVIPDDPTLEQLNELVKKSPKDISVLVERAKYYGKKGKYSKAIIDMKSVMEIDSTTPEYYHLLADFYMDSDNSAYAITTMELLTDIHPERIPSLLKLSEFYFIVKDYDKSINTINSILYISPSNPEAYFMLGVNFKEQNRLVKAKNSFLTAVENDPEHIDAWLELGKLAEHSGDKLAETYYKNALLVDKDNVNVLHHLAYYYQNNSQMQKAIDTYHKIVAIDPTYTSAYLNSGLIYLKQDSIPKAFDSFNTMVKTDKSDPRAYYYRGVAHYLGNNDKAAKADFEQALKIYPEYEDAQNMLDKINKK